MSVNENYVDMSNEQIKFNLKYPISVSKKKQVEHIKNDTTVCDVCGATYKKCNGWHHRQTKVHKVYENLNNKLRKILVNEN